MASPYSERIEYHKGKFHPSQRAWPSGMPESIAQTEHKEPAQELHPGSNGLNLVDVDCPNGCGYHVRVDEKVKEYNLSGHLLHCSPGNTPAPNFEERKTSRPTILEEAGELVDGPREAHYGHPYDDFSRVIGAFNKLFTDYLKQPLETRHWPLIMQLVKLSREINEPKRDNWVDGAGYWRTLEKVFERDGTGEPEN